MLLLAHLDNSSDRKNMKSVMEIGKVSCQFQNQLLSEETQTSLH